MFRNSDEEARIADSRLTLTNGVVRATVPRSIIKRFAKAMGMNAADVLVTSKVTVIYRDRKIDIHIEAN